MLAVQASNYWRDHRLSGFVINFTDSRSEINHRARERVNSFVWGTKDRHSENYTAFIKNFRCLTIV